MDRKLHMGTIILIPTFKIYVFFIFQTDRQTDRQMERQMEKFIWCGLGNLSVPPGKN
jgi:hypothetical protein